MALNYSHRPIFPAHISEDNLESPMRIVNGYLVEGIPEKNAEVFTRQHNVSQDSKEMFEYGRERVDSCGSPDSVSKDILDLLPSDPFDMDTTFTAITALTGWLEDLEVGYGGYMQNNSGLIREDYSLFAGLNLIWNNAMRFQSFPSNFQPYYNFFGAASLNPYCEVTGDSLPQTGTVSACSTGDFLGYSSGISSGLVPQMGKGSACCSSGDEGIAHEALSFALGYLGVKDLLSVERVCKSLHSTVQNDPLMWRNIHIDHKPLNDRITDDILLQLSSRAQGNMQCLSLVECHRITDDGLRRVLEANPNLTKLCVPGCTRLNIEGIVNILKSLNCKKGFVGIRHLRIGGLYGVTHEHIEQLNLLLGIGCQEQQNDCKPHFYSRGSIYLLCDDDRPIDLEVCPKCTNLRLVYDCPSEACQIKDSAVGECRACTICIARCAQCGRCINSGRYVETFCLEKLCSDCNDHIECHEKQEDENEMQEEDHECHEMQEEEKTVESTDVFPC